MAKYNGVGIQFGVTSSMSTVTGVLQTRDHGYESDKEIVRNGIGDTVSATYYDLRETATFDFVTTGASGGVVTATFPAVGDKVTVVDTIYTQIANTNWLVDNVDTKGSNTTALRVSLKMTRYPAIA